MVAVQKNKDLISEELDEDGDLESTATLKLNDTITLDDLMTKASRSRAAGKMGAMREPNPRPNFKFRGCKTVFGKYEHQKIQKAGRGSQLESYNGDDQT